MYKRLTAELKNTRKTFTETCKFLGIDPEYADPDMLDITRCDNCNTWVAKNNIIFQIEGSAYCRICDDLDTMRF
jgi:hypothetical protein